MPYAFLSYLWPIMVAGPKSLKGVVVVVGGGKQNGSPPLWSVTAMCKERLTSPSRPV